MNMPGWNKYNKVPIVEMGGCIWYWCEHHVWDKDERKKPRSGSASVQSSYGTISKNKTLTLSEKTKSALMIKYYSTEDQANEFLNSVN